MGREERRGVASRLGASTTDIGVSVALPPPPAAVAAHMRRRTGPDSKFLNMNTGVLYGAESRQIKDPRLERHVFGKYRHILRWVLFFVEGERRRVQTSSWLFIQDV